MHATRVRIGPGRSPSRSPKSRYRTSPLSRSNSSSPSRATAVPPLYPANSSRRSPTLPFAPHSSFPPHPLDDIPPLQQRVSYPALSPKTSPVNAKLHQYRKFVSTPSTGDLSVVLQEALQDLYEKRPADELLHLIYFLRNRVATRDGLEDTAGLEAAEVLRLKEENQRLRRHLSPDNADLAAANEVLATELQKKTVLLDESKTRVRKLEKQIRALRRQLKRRNRKLEKQAVEIVEHQWLHEKSAEEIEASLQFLFSEADDDGNGVISEREFRSMLSSSTLKVSDEEVQYLLDATKRTPSGEIEYAEFVPTAYHLLARYHVQLKKKQKKEAAKAKKLKRAAEKDRSEDQFAQQYLLTELTPDQLAEQLRSVYDEADTDNDGSVSGDEMFNILNKVRGLPPFTRDDVDELMKSISGGDAVPESVSFEEFVPVAFTILKRVFLNQMHAAQESKSEESSSDSEDSESDSRAATPARSTSEERASAEEDGENEALREAEEFLNTIDVSQLEEMLHDAFVTADTDSSGFLDAEELKAAFASNAALRVYADDNVVRRMMEHLDANSDGKLNYMEFIPLGQEVLKTVLAAELQATRGGQVAVTGDDTSESASLQSVPRNSDEMEELMLELFLAADTDKNGTIEPDELAEILQSVPGVTVTTEMVNDIVAQLDTNGDGRLDYNEFCPLAWELLNPALSDVEKDDETAASPETQSDDGDANDDAPANAEQMEALMFELFLAADTDQSGTIEPSELETVLNGVPGLEVTPQLVENIVKQLDANGDGRLDYHEFCPLAWELLNPNADNTSP